MDLSTLQNLATNGFSAVRADQLGDLAIWCRDYSEATGDARFAAVAQGLLELSEWWSEHDESGGIPVPLRDDIEAVIKNRLPDVLAAESPRDAGPLARIFREEIERHLSGPQQWIADGYVEREP